MIYVSALVEGLLSFISPCLLPMLPLYVTYFAAGESNRRRTFVNALGFMLGFSLVYIGLGGFAGALGALLWQYEIWVNIITGAIVVALGLHFLGVFRLDFMHKLHGKQANTKELRFGSSLFFGITFAIGCSPCVGPFLGTALMRATQRGGGALSGMLMLLVYSIGLGVPFVACALLMDQLKGAIAFLRRHQKTIRIVSGALLVVMGILMATGLFARLFLFH